LKLVPTKEKVLLLFTIHALAVLYKVLLNLGEILGIVIMS